ncbi:hypothetical protein RCL1_006468 [Eukaryota sp. TZLM3-RCL]
MEISLDGTMHCSVSQMTLEVTPPSLLFSDDKEKLPKESYTSDIARLHQAACKIQRAFRHYSVIRRFDIDKYLILDSTHNANPIVPSVSPLIRNLSESNLILAAIDDIPVETTLPLPTILSTEDFLVEESEIKTPTPPLSPHNCGFSVHTVEPPRVVEHISGNEEVSTRKGCCILL